MKSVRILNGKGIPLRRSDVDTDQIIPADWLKRVERTGFEAGLFSTWREDRDFVLNDQRYAGANVLVAGPSFGVGSSREHAVWAIQQYGFDAVIAPSFSDIFRNNCTKNGLVPVALPIEIVEKIWAAIESDRHGTFVRGSPGGWCEGDVPDGAAESASFPERTRRHRHHTLPRRRHRDVRDASPRVVEPLIAAIDVSLRGIRRGSTASGCC